VRRAATLGAFTAGGAGALVVGSAACSLVWGFHPLSGPSDAAPGMDAAEEGSDDAGDDGADAGPCVAVAAGPVPEAGGAACPNDAQPCSPQDVRGFAPHWQPPEGPGLGVCTTAQLEEVYDLCIAPSGTMAGCASWISASQANRACDVCAFTPVGGPQYGAMIFGQNLYALNVAGCLALVEPCNAPCATAINAQVQCAIAACDATCTTQTSTQCAASALGCSACSGFSAAAEACTQTLYAHKADHPAVATCGIGSNDQRAAFISIGSRICGP